MWRGKGWGGGAGYKFVIDRTRVDDLRVCSSVVLVRGGGELFLNQASTTMVCCSRSIFGKGGFDVRFAKEF